MTTSVVTVDVSVEIRSLLHHMSRTHADYAAVVDRDQFLGLVPLPAICESALLDLDDRVVELMSYICGRPAAEHAHAPARARPSEPDSPPEPVRTSSRHR
jgi:hypothetical protein